ncbi:ATP-binding protein [Pelomonas sp. CA6]|uniref:sensor histidine kinase n=1 Tax=Pelomonas sp. CA6 TaxID=2907999 RepID=UPI001F4C2503|nr:ATP-binding protein [Pelomonas sp. CA6]MCH7343857.1 ATP-binding protein [Pelomonas sp. CA6]
MRVPKPSSVRRLRLSAMAWLFAALLIVVVWLAVAGVLVLKRNDALSAEAQQNRNLARAFTEQSLRVLATADQAMQRLSQAQAQDQLRPEDLVRYANETGLAPQILVQLSVVDAQGRFRGSNLDPSGQKTGPVDLSAREHIKAHLAQPDRPAAQDALFIGKSVLGKVSRRWTIQLSRAVRSPDGRMIGVVVASLDPSYFHEVYRGVDVGSTGSVAMVGEDLGVRARVVGGAPSAMGSQLAPNSPFAARTKDAAGTFRAPSSLDGTERIYAFQRIGPYPLFIIVSTGVQESLSDWRDTRTSMLGLCAVVTLALLAAASIFVTGLRRLEQSHEALRHSEAEAQAANQAKSEFLAAISHELRTPLTSIRGFAELMERRLQEERFREAASLIRKGAEHLNALLTEILDLAKVEAGSMQLSPEPVDLRALLNGTVDFFALSASAKGLKLASELDPDLPARVFCDGLRLKQILNNLLSNALKFTEQGEIVVRVRREGEGLLVQVQDSGPGIPLDKQEQIFEKFRQGDARVSYQHGGTGLGLALSRALAELMEGRLTVRSQPGEGACFELRLPLRSPPADTQPARQD